MEIHDKDINLSIETNIGTANIVRACKKLNKIDFFTNYVYPCKKGNYKRDSASFNNYGWSKLGGECACKC